jgi:hypothetical protein
MEGCVSHACTCFINRFLGYARGCSRLAIFHTKKLEYVQQILSLAQYESAIVAALKQNALVLLHGAGVRAYKESLCDFLELSNILKLRPLTIRSST